MHTIMRFASVALVGAFVVSVGTRPKTTGPRIEPAAERTSTDAPRSPDALAGVRPAIHESRQGAQSVT